MIERLAKFLSRRGIDFGTFGAVFDIGSRDGRQSIELSNLFQQADVVAIECNRGTLDQCRLNTAPYPRIKLVEKAVNSYTGRCSFFPIDPTRTVTSWADGNPGASSLFVATNDYPVETYVQNEVEVECTRLDDLCGQLGIDVIDLIWMDLQGAELLALQSAGALLDKVRYIYTEVSHRPIYSGQCLFDDVDAFLVGRGFRRCTQINRARWQQDVIYENVRELVDVVIPLGSGDPGAVELLVRSARKFVEGVRHVYVVGAADPGLEGTRFIDEKIFPFDVAAVRRFVASEEQAERYLQQLIRLHFSLVVPTCLEQTLVAGAGITFLKNCRFVAGGRPVLDFGGEPHASHFAHMTRLHPALHQMFAYSGAAPCILYKRSWLTKLHEQVETQNGNLAFWKAYLQAIDPAQACDGASDSEVYFSFCLLSYPGDVVIRRFFRKDAEDLDDADLAHHEYICLRPRLAERARPEKLVMEQP